ncbi:ribonuclease H-like domain-containing protein [Tanacetum coccineum]|uniref:Ribonuclease H-like domain-containing protein n=1 Tax=Tanacetum coccineum TaxID=301880 RepID=A0ABQ5FDV6_9ASTR
MELMEKRRKHFVALRAQEKRNRPPTKAQKRSQMSTYLKHMGGYKHKQLKGKSYDEIQKLFDKEMKRVNTFVAMSLEAQESNKKKVEGSEEKAKSSIKKMLGRKRAGKEQQQESPKRQKMEDDKETDEHEEVEADDTDELKNHLVIVKDDEIALDVIPLATKPPMLVEYKLLKEGIMRRLGDSLETLWKLVKTKHGDSRPEDEYERVLDAKTLFDAMQTRFGSNDATRKTQKTLLKQMYKNFNALSTKSLESIFNMLQKIVSQLAILGENISQEDLNLKFLRSLPFEWNTHVVVWRNKLDLDTMSFDDLYNNFKIVEQEVKRTVTSSSSSSSQNMAFLSSPGSTNEVNTVNNQASTASTLVSTASTPDNTGNLSDATVYKTGKKITINGSDTVGYEKSKVECFNCHKMRHFARECRGPRNQDNRNRNQDSSRRTVNVEETSFKAMVAIDGAGFDWSFMADEEVAYSMALRLFFRLSATYKRGLASVEEQLVFYKKNEVMFCDQIVVLKRDTSFKDLEINALKSEIEKLKKEKESNQIKIDKFKNASKSLDKLIGSQISDNSRKGVGFVSYNAVPPPPTGLFSPPTIDLSNSGLEEFQQPEFEGYRPKASKSVCKDTSNEVKKNFDAPLGKKLVSEKEKQTVFPTMIESAKQQEKPARKPVNFDHVQAHCNYHQKEGMVNGNNYTRVNYKYSAKKAHPNSHRNMTPRVVLIKTSLKPLNTARPVNTAHPKTTVYSARPKSCFSKLAQSTVKRPYQSRTTLTNKNSNQKVNTAKEKVNTVKPKAVNTARTTSAVVNAIRENQVNDVKASGHLQKEDQGYVDSGFSRHMTRNMSYLSDFKEFDRGYVTFGGGARGGRIN